MIARASRVFPGVLFSVLLAGSVLAAPSQAAAHDSPVRKTSAHETRRLATGARQKASRSITHHRAVASHRRVPTSTAAFVDDAFRAPRGTDDHGGWHQTGIASWYGGRRWQGNRTASGGIYDENELTAAHATLPLGSHVRVTLVGTDRSVVVTITDRPGTRRRIIDLSRGAAAALGILARGVAVVTLSQI